MTPELLHTIIVVDRLRAKIIEDALEAWISDDRNTTDTFITVNGEKVYYNDHDVMDLFMSIFGPDDYHTAGVSRRDARIIRDVVEHAANADDLGDIMDGYTHDDVKALSKKLRQP